MQRNKLLDNLVTYTGAALVIFIVIAPLLWLFISSISTLKELLNVPVHWIPQEPTFERYWQIIFATGSDSAAVFRRSILNSFIVASSVTIICVGFGSLAAYSFARLNFAGQGKLMYLMLFSYMLPPIMIMVPLYTIMRDFALMDTLRGLVIVYSALIMPFAVWIMRGYFLTIPGELEDAARIDGCSRLGALFRVVMPLSAPSPASKTIPVAISEFVGRHAIDYGMMATGGVVAAIPPILIALLFQRYLISGLTSGAVKG
jgi:multiple sugar transport system permease protein